LIVVDRKIKMEGMTTTTDSARTAGPDPTPAANAAAPDPTPGGTAAGLTTTDDLIDVPAGLKGVAAAETTIGDVQGRRGFYHYRQYSATDLAARRTLEDVWRLLIDGDLPAGVADREAFDAEVRPLRAVPADVNALLAGVAATAGATLGGLRSAVSLLAGADGMGPIWDLDAAATRHDLLRLAAATPTLVAALWRLSRGLDPIAPDPALGHAANYLWMLSGEVPSPESARAVEQYLILTLDHGWNASTFTARVIASTGADAGAAVTGAIGALSGPLHGGAPSRALDTLDAIGTLDAARPWVRAALDRHERIMGFGHPVYRTHDPRSVMLRSVAEGLGGDLVDLAVAVESVITEELARRDPGNPRYANVEFYAGVVMSRCGLDRALFTPTFAVSRVIGWCANIAEQAQSRRIIRPSARYVGPPAPQPFPDLV
jgi:citrate synthase